MSKTVLITGGTRGIGRACAERFARAGYAVSVIARGQMELRKLQDHWAEHYPTPLTTLALDLTDAAAIASVPRRAFDVVILNAATYRPGGLLEAKTDHFEDLLTLNVLGNHRLLRHLGAEHLPGHLVVIGSTGTDHFKPYMTAYVATKYALRGLFLGWQAELADAETKTTLVAPGATLTSSWDGETPPPDILQPAEVAQTVYACVRDGREGRVLVEN